MRGQGKSSAMPVAHVFESLQKNKYLDRGLASNRSRVSGSVEHYRISPELQGFFLRRMG